MLSRHRQRPERERTPQRPLLCVTYPTVTICLLFAPPLPPFNCWMSLQSCVPKTINSREQSYTKKGVSPEGDGYPWKPPPFLSSLGKAGEWGGGGRGGSTQNRVPENAGIDDDLRKARLLGRVRKWGQPETTTRAGLLELKCTHTCLCAHTHHLTRSLGQEAIVISCTSFGARLPGLRCHLQAV